MPLGIIQTANDEDFPGTELLVVDERAGNLSDVETSRLKRVIYHGVDTVLVPQPSEDDPNDPLLWPRWKKEVAFWVIFVNTIVFAISPAPILAPSTFALAGVFQVPLTKIAELSGYELLVVGALGPFVSVLAQKYGKRPQYLFASIIGTIGTVICIAGAEQTNYNTLLAGRLVQGLGITAWESLAVASVGDMFYLHERGWRTAIMVVALACMASLVAIIAGAMTENVGWRNLFVATLPFDIVCLVLTVLFIPETQFRRHHVPVRTTASQHVTEEKPTTTTVEEVVEAKRKMTFTQGLRVFSGSYTKKNILHLLVEIFIHILNPAIIWVMLVAGIQACFFVVIGYILSQIWSVPPYNLNVAQNGYFFVGPLVGGVLAVFVGPVCDWSARALARINKGIFEAEFRIPINILSAIFYGLGWFIFMWDVDHPRANGYYLGSFCYGLLSYGVSVASTSCGLYVLDSFPRQSTEVFVLQMMLKNFIFYAFSTFINTWAAEDGPGEVFKVFGIISLALLGTCIPMYIFGKLNRKYMHRMHRNSKIFRAIS